MNSSEEAPKLNPWPFIAADGVLLSIVYALAIHSPAPLVGLPLIAVIVCGLGATLATLPFLMNQTRRQELVLAERQNEIAALAQTTAASAEQLSIAVASLHGIAEASSKNLRFAEQLPQKLQDKINEFKTQLNEVAVTDNEALAQEVNVLRSTETERLESALDAIRKTTTQLATLEASSRKQVAEISTALARFSESAHHIGQAGVNSLAQAKADAERSIASAHSTAASTLESAVSAALTQIEGKFAAFNHQLSARFDQLSEDLDAKIASLPTHLAPLASPASSSPASEDVGASAPLSSAPGVDPKAAQLARKRAGRKPSSEPDELGLGLELPPVENEYSSSSSEDVARPPTPSADGLTRLLVTAYIGIGNKLYARGEGPGLQWDKGSPLQFVSIGKWRWETNDTSSPVTLKLLKNDEIECVTLGSVALEAGHQQEVTANF